MDYHRERDTRVWEKEGASAGFGMGDLYLTLMTFGIILLVGTFIFYLLALTTLNITSSPNSPILQSLIDVIKNLGTILGTALATIIAFYFGIRGSETATEKAVADMPARPRSTDSNSSHSKCVASGWGNRGANRPPH